MPTPPQVPPLQRLNDLLVNDPEGDYFVDAAELREFCMSLVGSTFPNHWHVLQEALHRHHVPADRYCRFVFRRESDLPQVCFFHEARSREEVNLIAECQRELQERHPMLTDSLLGNGHYTVMIHALCNVDRAADECAEMVCLVEGYEGDTPRSSRIGARIWTHVRMEMSSLALVG